MPSLHEAYGITVQEYVHGGLQVVASDLPGLREAGDGYASVCYFFSGSVVSLRAALDSAAAKHRNKQHTTEVLNYTAIDHVGRMVALLKQTFRDEAKAYLR